MRPSLCSCSSEIKPEAASPRLGSVLLAPWHVRLKVVSIVIKSLNMSSLIILLVAWRGLLE